MAKQIAVRILRVMPEQALALIQLPTEPLMLELAQEMANPKRAINLKLVMTKRRLPKPTSRNSTAAVSHPKLKN